MADIRKSQGSKSRRLRSQLWFDNPENPSMTALYLERYLNYGLTRTELTSGRPIIGIAQTGSDLSPCNRHHLQLAGRVRDGIRVVPSLIGWSCSFLDGHTDLLLCLCTSLAHSARPLPTAFP